MDFERLDPDDDLDVWRDLRSRAASATLSFSGFRAFDERIFRGGALALRRRVELTRYGLFDRTSSGTQALVACAIHFRGKAPELAPSSSVGGLFFDPSLDLEQLRDFGSRLLDAAGTIDLIPYNGHLNFGLSHPAAAVDPKRISFLCSPLNPQTQRFLSDTGLFRTCRELRAYVTVVTPDLIERTRLGVVGTETSGFHTRPLSLPHLKRDIAIYNRLVNTAMAGQPNFFPLQFDEEWELWKAAWPTLEPAWFRFLMKADREIGFCFAVPDYNRILKNEYSDARNGLALLSARIRGRHTRGRLVYSGLLPEFQGQKCFKFVRHRVIAEMIRSGVTEFESSYVDEANAASSGNVASTGGSLSHRFSLYQSAE